MGSQLQPDEDGIVTKADTFHLSSANYYPEYIYSSADSFLLGNYYDSELGTTRASLLAQFSCPIVEDGDDSRKIFPDNSAVDSIVLDIYYRSYFGSGNGLVELSVYEMNQGTFEYSKMYPSNLELTDYCDESVLLGTKLLKADDAKDSVSSGTSKVSLIRLKLDKDSDFANRFFDIEANTYHSFAEFTDFFKGLYIKSEYGSDVMFHVIQLDLNMHYHFTYPLEGNDTTVNGEQTFPANTEVRQINIFEHPDIEQVKTNLDAVDSINYVSSPANIYTRVSLPMSRMCDTIIHKTGDRTPYVNAASLVVNVSEVDLEKAALPASNLMLIKESAMERFFKKKEALSDTCAIVASISSKQIDATTYEYYYSFDISDIVLQELRAREEQDVNVVDDLDMLLVPVNPTKQSTVITAVKAEYLMTNVVLKSAQNKSKPMKLSLVYSGF